MVPKQIVEVLQGIVILAVATAVPEVRRILLSSASRVAARLSTPRTSNEAARR
jgi:Ca2+/Na+ antiporter